MSGSGIHEVFADPRGRRRRAFRATVATLAVGAIAALGLAVPYAFSSSAATSVSDRPTVTIRDVGPDAPIVGAGPLERVVELRPEGAGVRGVEPFTGADLGLLPGVTAAGVTGHRYAIQRYGYAATGRKTISLTFDDGPDPVVTPKLLDVLARHHVPATFFVIGRAAVRHPEIVTRMAREGHAVGGHTMTHPDVAHQPDWREQEEVVGAARVLRALTGRDAAIWRMPYTAADPDLERHTVDGLLRAQRLGYVHASYDFDTLDWEHDARPSESVLDIPLPDFDQDHITVLLHDAGGPNRERSVAYVERLVVEARARGYTFTTMPQAVPAVAAANTPVTPTPADRAVLAWATVVHTWPRTLMIVLFAFALLCSVGTGLVHAVLALIRRRRRDRVVWPSGTGSRTSVVLAAFDEEVVIERTVRSILDSEHPVDEVVVVDDGSRDRTAEIVARLGLADPRVQLVVQENAGKSAALNRGIARAVGDIVVTLDADTILTPSTIGNLVRHFDADDEARRADPGRAPLGAVAGTVRVGNRRTNLLTRWQALEYVTQIGLDRAAQDQLGAISIVPGACAAWRREAILAAGGYSTDTLAEDCDLALSMHRLGWRLTQEDHAVAYTEAPETVDDLLKQRSRWTFGTLQATFKHRRLLFGRRTGFLGWYVLPNYVLSLVLPLFFLPFVAVMAYVSVRQEGPGLLLGYFALFLALHVALAALTVRLMGERWSHLLSVPLYRIVHEPLRAYLLYTSVHLAIIGGRMGWQKLDRTGTVQEDGGSTAVPRPRAGVHVLPSGDAGPAVTAPSSDSTVSDHDSEVRA
ncbi:polysaccharide deacetylase family protein [Agilicoccus flavus]|uniref:polysaccharide deacetylase family protein n=1 Tax=Agilicoccus flavus TaxID=2775968 RepID=UPI001CF68250|nr:polysaccharide deacetylase family protein [Agilicoccus flavus]